jgi:hypothetical protein
LQESGQLLSTPVAVFGALAALQMASGSSTKGTGPPPPPPTNYTVTITGNALNVLHTIQVSVTVQ